MRTIRASADALLRSVPSLAVAVAGRLLTCRRVCPPEGGAHPWLSSPLTPQLFSSRRRGCLLCLDGFRKLEPPNTGSRADETANGAVRRSLPKRWAKV